MDDYLNYDDSEKILNLCNHHIHDLNIYSTIQPRIRMVLRLHLGKNCIRDQGAAILSKCLESNKVITHLTLESNHIGDSGCSCISEWLSTNSSLVHLGLGGNHIGDYGCSNLGTSISKHNALQILVLCSNRIKDIGFINFCQQIQTHKGRLKSVIFWYNRITSLGGKALEDMLGNNKTVTRFEYSDDLVEETINRNINHHLEFNRLYQSEYPQRYLLTVSYFLKIWYYLSRNINYYHISSELVRSISDFLGVSYQQSILEWEQTLRQEINNKHK